MSRTPRTLLVGMAVLAGVAGLLLSGCGSDEAATTTTTTTDGATTTQPAASDDATADDAADTDSSSNGEFVDVCTVLTVEEVGAIVGGTVTVEADPGGGCSFDQEDPRAPTLSFASTDVGSDDTDGTFNESRVGAFSVLTDPTKEEPGIGDYSAVASGTIGGESQQGAGLTQVGPTLVQVTLIQGNGLDGAAVRTMTVAGLTLAASKL